MFKIVIDVESGSRGPWLGSKRLWTLEIFNFQDNVWKVILRDPRTFCPLPMLLKVSILNRWHGNIKNLCNVSLQYFIRRGSCFVTVPRHKVTTLQMLCQGNWCFALVITWRWGKSMQTSRSAFSTSYCPSTGRSATWCDEILSPCLKDSDGLLKGLIQIQITA